MNRIKSLFGVQYPIVQGGMVWCSGWRLASAVSNAGGLGLIGSGSMDTGVLREHITKCQNATSMPFGVNVPLLYSHTESHLKCIIDLGVKIVFTSAGNPKYFTALLKAYNITVVHVVSSVKFALKAEDAGCNAVVAEGFEAGGHNGKEETTTLCLVPAVKDAVKIPVIAAGGIGDGRAMLAAIALGAEGVQVGSRFAASQESSAHDNFKQKILNAQEGDTKLLMKKATPVRLLRNTFFEMLEIAESTGASKEALQTLLGNGRSRLGMYEGNLEEGELEIGQVSALITEILPAGQILENIWRQYLEARQALLKK